MGKKYTGSAVLYTMLLWAGILTAQEARFIPNEGQWQGNFQYKLQMNHALVFFDASGYTALVQQKDQEEHHGHFHPDPGMDWLAYKVEWRYEGQTANSAARGRQKASYPHHYFLGNDPSQWRSHVPVYYSLRYEQLFPGIELRYYQLGKQLKYDIILQPGQDPSDLQMHFDGIENLNLKEGRLQVQTELGTAEEYIPEAYQMIGEQKVLVDCRYRIEGRTASFSINGTYRKDLPLVIDPVLVFSSFSGSPGTHWGYSATYNSLGEFYGGGASLDHLFPATTGVLQDSTGGQADITINKFSNDGSQMLYATYLGGDRIDLPHSLVVNDQDELYLIGNTGSADFPTTPGAYQSSFGSGPPVNIKHTNFDFPNGSDLVLAHISADGSTLLNSTYLGGSGNDGINKDNYYNYGDQSRSEIIHLPDGKIAFCASTFSTDLTFGHLGISPGDASQNAVIAVMDAGLSQLEWGQYFGGSLADAGYSLFNSGNSIYLTGSTESNDLPGTAQGQESNFQGNLDGYLARFDRSNGQLQGCTYMGTSDLEQSFLVTTDRDGEVYCYGQSRGQMTETPGHFVNPGSHQFVRKYSPDLTQLRWGTQVGSGQNKSDLVPTALMVDDCFNIYLSGWNGSSNHAAQGASNTHNLPVTADAFQANTDGSDFYFMIMSRDAGSLLFGTYFGGSSNEHVDGGTSRFSPDGVVYQAACAGCQSQNGFPTTPQAFAPTKPNTSCNFGAIKFDFENTIRSHPSVNFDRDVDTLCDDLEVLFTNNSLNANKFYWDFGNGQTSTDVRPSVVYDTLGQYTVTLVAIDTVCDIADTSSLVINHDQSNEIVADFSENYVGCDSEGLAQFHQTSKNANQFQWFFGDGKSNTGGQVQHYFPDTGRYEITLIATDSLCGLSDTITREIHFLDTALRPVFSLRFDGCGENAIIPDISNTRKRYSYKWWLNGSPAGTGRQPQLKVYRPGQHSVRLEANDPLCHRIYHSDDVIQVDELDRPTFIPNIFTPNDDGKNDAFAISGESCEGQQSLRIYNRWGQLVFATDKPFEEFWDGTYEGRPVPQGVYSYVLQNGSESRSDHLTLLR